MFDKLEKILTKTMRMIAFIMFSIMIIVVFAQVILRYFTTSSLAWSEEISRFLLIWISFIGVTLVHYSPAGHPGMDFLAQKLPAKARAVVDLILNSILIIGFIALTIAGVNYTVTNHQFTSAVLGWPNSYKYAIFPISMALMGIKSLRRLLDDVKGFQNGGAEA